MAQARLTTAEIEQTWGSVAAYEEEQRRCGVYQIEARQQDRAQALSLETRRTNIGNGGSFRRAGTRTRFSLRFFGQQAQ